MKTLVAGDFGKPRRVISVPIPQPIAVPAPAVPVEAPVEEPVLVPA